MLSGGLGFGLVGNSDIHRSASRRVYGHPGLVSSVGLADPEKGIACVVVTTGLLDAMTNARRLRDATQGALESCLS